MVRDIGDHVCVWEEGNLGIKRGGRLMGADYFVVDLFVVCSLICGVFGLMMLLGIFVDL